MKPTLSARQRVIRASDIFPSSWSCTMTEPFVARSSPAIRFRSVDLPDPEGPISARYSPSSTVRSRSTSTGIRNSSRRYSFVTPCRTIDCVGDMGLLTFRMRLIRDLDHLAVAQGLGGIHDDRFARLQARLDAGQVVGRHRRLDAAFLELLPAADDPGERMAVLLEERRLGDEQEGQARVRVVDRLVGQEVDGGHELGEEEAVGVDDLNLGLDGPARAVPHWDDLAEPAAIALARDGADGDLGGLA